MSSFYRSRGKRLFDVALASSALVVIAPVQIVIASLVYRKLGRPILFRQLRPGRNGEPFTLLKFRTMRESKKTSGEYLADALRMTSFGAKLRKTSLDELPELWNVLRGDMSLVGPRPLLMEYLPRYLDEQMRRHEMRPGITGWAQINGRNGISWERKFEYDVWYVDHYSFALDVKILLKSIMVVLAGKGVAAQGRVTAEEFFPEV